MSVWVSPSSYWELVGDIATDILVMAVMCVLVLHSPDVGTGKNYIIVVVCVCLLRVQADIGCWPKNGGIPVVDTACM